MRESARVAGTVLLLSAFTVVIAFAQLGAVTAPKVVVVDATAEAPRKVALVTARIAAPPESPGKVAPKAIEPAGPAAPAADAKLLVERHLLIPVEGIKRAQLVDNFDEKRGGVRKHEALDIMAARGTPVVAVGDGRVAKLFRSVFGGITVYQFDADDRFVYYYAHLDKYAEGLKEGAMLRKGDPVGYVGSTGNAPANAPHLHFAIFKLGPEKQWWKGTAVNPFPLLLAEGSSR
jgi:murein DD-endopeptidase MepM/ murein hydrolase activator NlpD